MLHPLKYCGGAGDIQVARVRDHFVQCPILAKERLSYLFYCFLDRTIANIPVR